MASIENNTASGRKTLLERLAALRIQPNNNNTNPPPTGTQTAKAPESPRYIPRSAQSTQAKFYSDKSDLPSSPSIGRRRKLINNLSSSSSSSTSISTLSQTPAPIDSPKYFPKQKVFDELEKVAPLNLPGLEKNIENAATRRHSATEVVTSFIDSFSILNSSLTSTASKLQLQNMNTSFAALQMDLKAAISTISDLRAKEEEKAKSNDQEDLEKKNKELEEQLKIALTQISELKLALEKEKESVEFLQNYMEEIIQLKDDGEQKILVLEKQLKNTSTSQDNDLFEENQKLKETIKLLELERLSNKNVCKQALQVLDSASNDTNIEELRQELKQKQTEIEKLRGREQAFKESNEIFQQKLVLLTEENRKLRGQRPLNHY